MPDNALCFEVRGDITIHYAAECLGALDRLLAELGAAVGEGTAIDWPIWKMDATTSHFGFQTEPVHEEIAEAADRVAAAYLDVVRALALDQPTGLPRAVEDAAADLLVAASKGGEHAGFCASGFWVEADLRGWSDDRARRPFPVEGSFNGAISTVCDGEEPYAVVGDRAGRREYRCYLSPAQVQEARDGLHQAVHVAGPLIFEPDCAAQFAIRPTDTFDVVGSAKTAERFHARRSELGLSAVASSPSDVAGRSR